TKMLLPVQPPLLVRSVSISRRKTLQLCESLMGVCDRYKLRLLLGGHCNAAVTVGKYGALIEVKIMNTWHGIKIPAHRRKLVGAIGATALVAVMFGCAGSGGGSPFGTSGNGAGTNNKVLSGDNLSIGTGVV